MPRPAQNVSINASRIATRQIPFPRFSFCVEFRGRACNVTPSPNPNIALRIDSSCFDAVLEPAVAAAAADYCCCWFRNANATAPIYSTKKKRDLKKKEELTSIAGIVRKMFSISSRMSTHVTFELNFNQNHFANKHSNSLWRVHNIVEIFASKNVNCWNFESANTCCNRVPRSGNCNVNAFLVGVICDQLNFMWLTLTNKKLIYRKAIIRRLIFHDEGQNRYTRVELIPQFVQWNVTKIKMITNIFKIFFAKFEFKRFRCGTIFNSNNKWRTYFGITLKFGQLGIFCIS